MSQFGTAYLTACKALKVRGCSDSSQELGEPGTAICVAQITGLEHELPPDKIARIFCGTRWYLEDEVLSSSERGGRNDERAVQDTPRSHVPR